jgi:ABC-2 type transport system ATP-binding protein
VIELESVTASYRSGFTRRRRVILDAIGFRVPKGVIAGYLGVNGAGKTTTIKLLVGINEPDAGRVRVGGLEAGTTESKRLLGYLPENPYFYEYLTPLEALDFYGRLSGTDGGSRAKRSLAVLEEVGLRDAAERPVREFSKGMRQRLGLAQALLHEPELLVLDEPLTGLDPMGRLALRDAIARQRQAGRTVFFSSHILSDVEAVCDHIVILDAGKIAYEGSVEGLLKTDTGAHRVAFDGIAPEKLDAIAAASGAKVERRGARHEVECPSRDQAERALAAVREAGGRLILYQPVGVTLEDYFIRTYGQKPKAVAP